MYESEYKSVIKRMVDLAISMIEAAGSSSMSLAN